VADVLQGTETTRMSVHKTKWSLLKGKYPVCCKSHSVFSCRQSSRFSHLRGAISYEDYIEIREYLGR